MYAGSGEGLFDQRSMCLGVFGDDVDERAVERYLLEDAETAQRDGSAFVAVLSGVTSGEDFHRYPALEIVEDLGQLADWLLKL